MANVEGGKWSYSGTTATYKVNGVTYLTVTGLAKNLALQADGKIAVENEDGTEGDPLSGLEVTEEPGAEGETEAVVVKVAITNAVLGTSNVQVKSASSDLSCKFELDNSIATDSQSKSVWRVSGTTATYKEITPTYYELDEDDPSKIIYHKETDYKDGGKAVVYATVKGLAKGIYAADDGSYVGIKTVPYETDEGYSELTAAQKKAATVDRGSVVTVDGNGVITLKKDVLSTTAITVTDGNGAREGSYTLTIDDDDFKDGKLGLEDADNYWKVSGTTATYQYNTTAGWELASTGDDAGKKITYSAAKTTVVATIKGLAKNLTVDDFTGAAAVEAQDAVEADPDADPPVEAKEAVAAKAAVKQGADVSGDTITLSKKMLGTTKVTITSADYKLALNTSSTEYELNVPNEKPAEADVWSISGTTATYKRVIPEYYTINTDGTEITYNKEEAVKDGTKAIVYATISGVSKDLYVDKDGNDYFLKSKKMDEDSGLVTETVAVKVTTAYTAPKDAEKDKDGNETVEAVKEEIGVITIADGVQNKANITLKDGNGKYTFAIDNSIAPPTVKEDTGKWTIKNGTATYTGQVGVDDDGNDDGEESTGDGSGYLLSADGKNLIYTKATDTSKNATQTLITITGLNKTLTEIKYNEDNDNDNDIAIDDTTGTVTLLNKDLLGDATIAIKEKGYKLANIDDSESEQEVVPTKPVDESTQELKAIDVWRISGTTATYKRVIPAYYTYDAAKNSYVYVKEADVKGEDGKALVFAQVTGLAKKDAAGKDIKYYTVDGEADNGKTTGSILGYIGVDDDDKEKEIEIFGDIELRSVPKTDDEGNELLDDDNNPIIDHYEGTIEFLTTDVIDKAVKLDTKKYAGFKLDLGEEIKADSVVSLKDEDKKPTWTIKGTTATLTGETKDGYTVTDGAITKVAGSSTANLITIKNLNLSNYEVITDNDKSIIIAKGDESKTPVIERKDGENGEAGTITIDKALLNKKNVTLEGVGNYTLAAISEVAVKESEENDPAHYWVVSKGEAKYYEGNTPGYALSSDGKTLAYSGAGKNDKLLFTITNLSTDLKADDNGQIAETEISVNDKTITIGESALAGKKVEVDKGFELALKDDLGVKDEEEIWVIKGTTATLYKGKTAGYSAADNVISYKEADTSGSDPIVTLKGLKSGLKVKADGNIDGIAIGSDGKITLDSRALGTGTVTVEKGTSKDAQESYTLKIDTENADYAVGNPEINDSYWDIQKAGTAIYTEEIEEGYKVDEEKNQIVYVKAQNLKTTLNNLNIKTSDLITETRTINGIAIAGGVIKINESLLTEKTVSLAKNSEYTLDVEWNNDPDESKQSKISDPIWIKTNKDTKAIYQQTVGKGYSLSDDGKSINYSTKDVTKTLATITGLPKELIYGGDSTKTDEFGKWGTYKGEAFTEITDAVTVKEETDSDATDKRGTITLAKNLIKLTTGDIKLGNKDNYKFDVESINDDDDLAVQDIEDHFVYNNGTVTIVDGKTAGWEIKQTAGQETSDDESDDVYNDRVISYTKASLNSAKASISGLAKGLDVNEVDPTNIGELTANITGENDPVTILSMGESGTVIVHQYALGTTDVKLNGTSDYKNLDLASGEDIQTASQPAAYAWRVSNTTATYKQINPAWYEDKDSSIVVHKEEDVKGATVATITGLKKGVTIKSDTNGDVLGFYESDGGFKEAFAGFTEYSDLNFDSDGTLVDDDSDGKPDKEKITLNEAVLGEGTIALKSDLYTLELGSASAPEVYGADWKTSGSNAVLVGGVTQGWVEKGDGKTINYVKGNAKTTIASITNIKNTSGMSGLPKATDGIRIVGVSAANLNQKKATLKDNFGLGYSLLFTGDGAAEVKDPVWNVNGEKATYVQSINSGYSQDDDYNINYSNKATTKTLATINGLNKDFTGSASAAIEALSAATKAASGDETIGTITLEKDWLGQKSVTLGKNDKFQFELGEDNASEDDFAVSKAEKPWWNYKNGTASFVQGSTEGWAFKENKDKSTDYKTLEYTKESSSEIAKVTGLDKTVNFYTDEENTTKLMFTVEDEESGDAASLEAITFEEKDSSKAVSVGGGSFVLSSREILDTKTGKVSIAGAQADKFTLVVGEASSISTVHFGAEGDDDETPKWYVNGTTAYLKAGTTEGWVYATDKNKNTDKHGLVLAKESLVADSLASAKITGLAKGLVVANKDYKVAVDFASEYGTAEGYVDMEKAQNVLGTYKDKIFKPGLTFDGDKITFITADGADDSVKSVALGTTNISLGGPSDSEYKFDENGFVEAIIEAPTWNLSNKGVATLKQVTKEGFTLNDDKTLLTYTGTSKDPEHGDAVLTISGLKPAASASAANIHTALDAAADDLGITAEWDSDGGFSSVIVIGAEALNGAKVTLTDKSKNFSLSLAEDVTREKTAERKNVTEWVLSSTTATYKLYDRGYYEYGTKGSGNNKTTDYNSIVYTAATKGTAFAAITGIKQNADISKDDNFDLKSKVFKVSTEMLEEGKSIKISSGDAFTLDDSGINASLAEYDSDAEWSYSNGKATFAASVSGGWKLSEDGKALNYIKKSTTKVEVASVTGVKANVEDTEGVILLTKDKVAGKKITLKGDGYTLALDSELANGYSIKSKTITVPAGDNDDETTDDTVTSATWSAIKSNTATLSGNITEGYWLSDDKKSVAYTASSKNKSLATVKGFNISTLSADSLNGTVGENDLTSGYATVSAGNKTITLNPENLGNGVTLSGGELSFDLGDYSKSVAGSTAADTIKATGDKVTINAGKGNDVITLGGKSAVYFYASGDGNDTVEDFDETNIIDSSKASITAENIRIVNSGVEVVIGKGAINLKSYNGDITIIDKTGKKTYTNDNDKGYIEATTAASAGRAALDEETSMTPIFETARISEVINPVATSDYAAAAELGQNPAELAKQSAIVYSGNDKK